MADVIPKLKILVLTSIIALLFSFILDMSSAIAEPETEPVDLQDIGAGAIPFVSIYNAVTMPDNPFKPVFIFFSSFLTIIQTFVISMIVISLVSNIIYHPDV